METFVGKSIFQKLNVGPVFYFEKQENLVKRETIEDPEQEILRFQTAQKEAISQLEEIYEKAKLEVGELSASIFQVHSMMLLDEDFLDSIYHMIRENHVNAEFATGKTAENFYTMFSEMDDEYMQARAADVKDIAERVISILQNRGTDFSFVTEPVILVAEDLAPSETVQMDKSKILGIVTRHGSANSHTAILARMMNIPALFGVDIQKSWHNHLAVVDGYEGRLTIDPSEEYLSKVEIKRQEEEQKKKLLSEMKGLETITKSGQKVHLYANIGRVSDVAQALLNDAEGIGLFRSEFLYLEASDYPTEEEQFQAYKRVAENMGGKRVIIRTLDIGADKQVDYFHLDKEENPALGYRAIRICLENIPLFKTQLRALLRASAFGTVAIMFPMIISVEEVRRAKEILEEVKTELKNLRIKYKDVEVGIMIETPAAVLISMELAKEVDFFSIGTNDLTQYLLALDRQNPKLDSFYNPHHKAVLTAIEMTVKSAHEQGIWVGICGELGSDLALTETFVKMGIDELSVSPSFIYALREKIRNID